MATIVGAVGADESVADVEAEYQLSREQVLAVIRYAEHVTAHLQLRHSVLDLLDGF